MQGCACVNGQFVAPSEAKSSVFDRGFLHSDVAYDVAHMSATSTWCANPGGYSNRARGERAKNVLPQDRVALLCPGAAPGSEFAARESATLGEI